MTPSKRSAAKIWLISEDETGHLVFDAICREHNLAARVEPIGTMKGINLLAQQLEELLKIAIGRRREGDCIIVLHDTDDSVQTNRTAYQTIRRICEKNRYKEIVTRLEAVQEIEAWLLADTGICKWLERTPRSYDATPKPSEKFEAILNDKHKMKWTSATKPKVLAHMKTIGNKSPSMQNALQVFSLLPCAQEKQQG